MERSTDDKTLLELEWLKHEMRHERNWRIYRSTVRSYVYSTKQYVIWDFSEGTPTIIDILEVGAVGVSWEEGFTFVLNSCKSDRQYTITARPRQVVPGVYMWLPGFADIRFCPMQYTQPGSTRRLTLPVMFRTLTHTPDVEGARYVSSMKDFKAAWPEILKG